MLVLYSDFLIRIGNLSAFVAEDLPNTAFCSLRWKTPCSGVPKNCLVYKDERARIFLFLMFFLAATMPRYQVWILWAASSVTTSQLALLLPLITAGPYVCGRGDCREPTSVYSYYAGMLQITRLQDLANGLGVPLLSFRGLGVCTMLRDNTVGDRNYRELGLTFIIKFWS